MLVSDLEKSVEQLRSQPTDRQLANGQQLRERLAALENKRAWEERFQREAAEKARAEADRKKAELERQHQMLGELAERLGRQYASEAVDPLFLDLIRRHPRKSKIIFAERWHNLQAWARDKGLQVSPSMTFASTFLDAVLQELRRHGYQIEDTE